MKIAITSTGSSPKNDVESRFGRTPWFLVYDTETSAWTPVENTDSGAMAHGAGIQTAEKLAKSGSKVVITGSCGPKAMQTLQAAGVQVFLGDARTVEEALKGYQAGQLKELTGPNGPGL